jgi:D-glycero-D-manno-heptose 1,7-bisphosphate phosphatase
MPVAPSGIVFLDRDGTINVERHYLASVSGMQLLPGAAQGIRMLNESGLAVVVISNQPVVARGGCSLETLDAINRRMVELLAADGAALDGIYTCPHRPEDGCVCRKPKIGLIEQAWRDLDARSARSFLVGDKCSDIQAGRNAGATTFLVRTGHGLEAELSGNCTPDYIVNDLKAAAERICCIIHRNDPASDSVSTKTSF